MTVWVCLCDRLSPPTPLPGPGISSSMSFEEEEEDEDENSSSSSQLNSNTRPSSATSRKSTRVSEELLLSRKADGSVARVGGEQSEVMQSWRACQELLPPGLFCPPSLQSFWRARELVGQHGF